MLDDLRSLRASRRAAALDLDLRGQGGVGGGFYSTIVSMALRGRDSIHDNGHCLGKARRWEDLGNMSPRGGLLYLRDSWIWNSLYKVTWVTGFLTMHLYLPIWSQVRLWRMMFASEKLRREPLWIHWYMGLGLEMAPHSIITWEPILADRTPLEVMGLVLSRTLSGPSAEMARDTELCF